MNDDDLILYYYDDGLDDAEHAAIAAALENDPALAARYRELRLSLERFDEPPVIRPPAQAVARWHRSIEGAAAGERAARPTGRAWHLPSFAWGAVAAALVGAVAIGIYFEDRGSPAPPVAGTTPEIPLENQPPILTELPAVMPASFARGVQVHLRESRQGIIRLAADPDADRTLLVRDILRQNRLFEQAARDNGSEDIARVLRAFEPVLLRLASEDVSDEDAAALRAKLAFELNVMLTKMERRESDGTKSI
jgi:hypothetical protein